LYGGGDGARLDQRTPRRSAGGRDRPGGRLMTDVQASNRDFEKYDQVRKAHTYRLAESATDEFDEDYEIATLDFGRFLRGGDMDKARFAEEFTSALHEIGFAVLTGHGVDSLLYDDMHELVLDLFATTSVEERMRFRAE